MRFIIAGTILVGAAAFAVGCNQAPDTEATSFTIASPATASKYMLTEEPDEAVGVIEARESASDGEKIAVVGRIGGAISPWVNGRAAFTLLDASMVLVAEGTDTGDDQICTGDCCATERAHATMLVKIVDATGRVLEIDSRRLLGIAENDMVVVCGRATKDKSGNVALIADGVFVRR
jgi:hypothetical protein